MMADQFKNRRKVVKFGAMTLAAPVLAGCGSESSDGKTGDRMDQPTEEGEEENIQSFDGWFDNTGNYDGVTDKTGSEGAMVEVGAGGSGRLFAPPAIRVSLGTTITWEWTGAGGSHNVVEEDGSFESKLTEEEGHTFKQTFDDRGTVRYFCEPHKTVGMKGVVLVE